jgi:hypothetical protein
MGTSIFLAKLIGPFAFAIGIALLIRRAEFRALADEFLASPALMFLSGAVTMPAGLAIVLTHNRWAMAWPVLITILGWLALIGGAFRLIAPKQTAAFGRRMIAHKSTLCVAAAVYIGVGVILCFFGYYHR